MHPRLVPVLRYADAPAAVEFLCSAFGFVRHIVHADPDEPKIILNAQLAFQGNLIMLGSSTHHEDMQQAFAWKPPKEAGAVTMCVAVIVDDPDAHHDHAAKSGAKIISAPNVNQGYPGRSYIASDPEGYVWTFTSYDPYRDAT